MKTVKVLAVVIMVAWSSLSLAQSHINGGTVQNVAIYPSLGNLLFIVASGSEVGRPACSTNAFNYVVSLSTPLGQQIMAVLLSARVSQTPIAGIQGTGYCDLFSNSETLGMINF
jgi:hypothetical protein